MSNVVDVTGRGLRGESFADVARRVGEIAGEPVSPTSSDADVLEALASAAGTEAGANDDTLEARDQAQLAALQAGQARDQSVLAGSQAVAVMAGAPQQGGIGSVIGADGGLIAVGLEPGMTAAYAIYTAGVAGKLTYHLRINTKTGAIRAANLTTDGDSASEGHMRAGAGLIAPRIDLTDQRQTGALSGSMISAGLPGQRLQWYAHGLWYDGIDLMWRAPGIKRQDENSKREGLYFRGGYLIKHLPKKPPILFSGNPAVLTGAAQRPKGRRSHQLIPAVAETGRYIYCIFDADDKALGEAFPASEGVNSYMVLMRRLRDAPTAPWVEVAQIVPKDTTVISVTSGQTAATLVSGPVSVGQYPGGPRVQPGTKVTAANGSSSPTGGTVNTPGVSVTLSAPALSTGEISYSSGRTALGSMVMLNGRLAILFSANDTFLGVGTSLTTQHYAIGAWITFLENPNAPEGSRLLFTDPVFLGYGIPNPGQIVDGEFMFALDVWRQSSYYNATFPGKGDRFVTPGTAMCKLVPEGPNGSELIRMSVLPGEPNPADDQYSEMRIVRLYRQSGASADWWSIRRTNQGPRESFGSNQPGGEVSWTSSANNNARVRFGTDGTMASTGGQRIAIGRSKMGNMVAAFAQDFSNRVQMALRLALNEAPDFTVSLKVENQSEITRIRTSYPDFCSWLDPATGKSMIGMMADYGRGIGVYGAAATQAQIDAGYTWNQGDPVPGNLYWYQFREEDLLAGAVTTSQSMAARQLANSIQFTGA